MRTPRPGHLSGTGRFSVAVSLGTHSGATLYNVATKAAHSTLSTRGYSMSSARSGYIVEVPLGLWSSVEFAFVEKGDDSGDITHVEAHLVDASGVYDLPSVLRDFAAVYMKTWLTVVRKDEDDNLIFERTPWVERDYWQEQTLERLLVLVEQGQARREADLD